MIPPLVCYKQLRQLIKDKLLAYERNNKKFMILSMELFQKDQHSGRSNSGSSKVYMFIN